jgi:hypothetical protein
MIHDKTIERKIKKKIKAQFPANQVFKDKIEKNQF